MKLKYFATYREITRCKEEVIPAPEDIWALLLSLSQRYGADFRKKLLSHDGMDIGMDAIIMVNGRNITHLDGKNTLLADSDAVSIFPLVAGG